MLRYLLYGLLLFIPVVIVLEFFVQGADPLLIFILSALAIIPLADFVGEATEELAIHIGPRWGGLLNATLGNAAELIITIFAIQRGLYSLVLASLTGSILGNLLLILGLSLLLGGLKNGIQTFDRRTAGMNATLGLLAVVGLLIPSLFDVAIVGDVRAETFLSEGVSIVMIVLYAVYVIYGFTSGSTPGHVDPEPEHLGQGGGADTASLGQGGGASESHTAKWSIPFSVGVLVASTLGIVFMSEALVGAVEHVSVQFDFLSEIFIGLIIIPLVGNVAEHLVAVQVAYKNKMELSLAVSLGSSLQIALFVAPVLVFVSLFLHPADQGPLFLVFTEFELIALVAAALIAANVAQDGESNWFEGAMLLGVYLIIAIAFFFLPSSEAAEATEHSMRFLPLFF
jgi:Ca2+:H+ antiporter